MKVPSFRVKNNYSKSKEGITNQKDRSFRHLKAFIFKFGDNWFVSINSPVPYVQIPQTINEEMIPSSCSGKWKKIYDEDNYVGIVIGAFLYWFSEFVGFNPLTSIFFLKSNFGCGEISLVDLTLKVFNSIIGGSEIVIFDVPLIKRVLRSFNFALTFKKFKAGELLV